MKNLTPPGTPTLSLGDEIIRALETLVNIFNSTIKQSISLRLHNTTPSQPIVNNKNKTTIPVHPRVYQIKKDSTINLKDSAITQTKTPIPIPIHIQRNDIKLPTNSLMHPTITESLHKILVNIRKYKREISSILFYNISNPSTRQ